MKTSWAAAVIVACLYGTAPSVATASECEPTATRIIGPFGAIDQPGPPLEVPATIRPQLPTTAIVRDVLKTRLSPMGEQVIAYDASAGEMDPNPRVSVVVHDAVTKTFDIAKELGRDARYMASCEFDLTPTQRALAIAYIVDGDGSGSAFVIIVRTGVDYQVVFKRNVGQGRIVFSASTIKLWEATYGKYANRPDSAKFECVWCDHRYAVTSFTWRNGKFVKIDSSRTKKMYDPAKISGTPLVAESAQKKLGQQ